MKYWYLKLVPQYLLSFIVNIDDVVDIMLGCNWPFFGDE
jgi:hypothetical protein